jgi:putative phosphoesterase
MLVKRSATLRVRDRAKLAVVADTHSRPHPRAEALLRAYAPDAILHAGDIGDLEVLDRLSAIAPVHAVRGNIDTRAAALPDVLVLDIDGRDQRPAGRTAESHRRARCAGRCGSITALRVLVLHIGVAGPRLRGDAAKLARAEGARIVVCGHSHVPFVGAERELTVFNPGSLGPRRFTLPIVFGTIELTEGRVRFAHVDCETGQAWLPPG